MWHLGHLDYRPSALRTRSQRLAILSSNNGRTQLNFVQKQNEVMTTDTACSVLTGAPTCCTERHTTFLGLSVIASRDAPTSSVCLCLFAGTLEMILTMVYDLRDYLLFWTLSSVFLVTKHNVSESGSVPVFR
jgi:hypothetical protein